MADTSITRKSSSTLGENAVDGLLTGIAAGLAMAVYLACAALILNEGIDIMLGRFAPEPESMLLTGILLHFATSGIYGMVFGVLNRWVERILNNQITWLFGLVYGFLLWFLAQFVYLPGTGSRLLEIPVIHFLIAHLVFVVVLGSFLHWRVTR